MIDTTHLKVRRKTTLGCPLIMLLSEGQVSCSNNRRIADGKVSLSDKGLCADWFCHSLIERDTTPYIPPKAHHRTSRRASSGSAAPNARVIERAHLQSGHSPSAGSDNGRPYNEIALLMHAHPLLFRTHSVNTAYTGAL